MVINQNARLAVISTFAECIKAKSFGRTALMKLCYFLQTLRGVPLGYRFTLYAYGPFDSEVLGDLSSAEALGLVTSNVVTFNGGYGYEIRSGKQARRAGMLARDFLKRYQRDIDWVINEFGGYSASDLELLSTIVFIDREISRSESTATLQQYVRRVKDVKPHFSESHIEMMILQLLDKGFLSSLCSSDSFSVSTSRNDEIEKFGF